MEELSLQGFIGSIGGGAAASSNAQTSVAAAEASTGSPIPGEMAGVQFESYCDHLLSCRVSCAMLRVYPDGSKVQSRINHVPVKSQSHSTGFHRNPIAITLQSGSHFINLTP